MPYLFARALLELSLHLRVSVRGLVGRRNRGVVCCHLAEAVQTAESEAEWIAVHSGFVDSHTSSSTASTPILFEGLVHGVLLERERWCVGDVPWSTSKASLILTSSIRGLT